MTVLRKLAQAVAANCNLSFAGDASTDPVDAHNAAKALPNINDGPCPVCGASWRGDPIPQEYIDAGYYGENPHPFYGRIIGIELSYDHPKHYDGVSYWCCPDCGTTWNRFTGEIEVITDAIS